MALPQPVLPARTGIILSPDLAEIRMCFRSYAAQATRRNRGNDAATAAQYLAESEDTLTKADNALVAGQPIADLLSLANADIAKVQPLVPEKK